MQHFCFIYCAISIYLHIPNTSLILNDIEQIDILDILSIPTMIMNKNRDLNRFCDFFMYEWVFEKKQKITLMKILSQVCEELVVQCTEILNTMGLVF